MRCLESSVGLTFDFRESGMMTFTYIVPNLKMHGSKISNAAVRYRVFHYQCPSK
jgi:hypothetical protein